MGNNVLTLVSRYWLDKVRMYIKYSRHGSCIQLDNVRSKRVVSQNIINVLRSESSGISGQPMPTNSMNIIILAILLTTCLATPIFISYPGTEIFAHPAVLVNSAVEDNLPNELRNKFYKNPNIAAGLAKESWFIDKEMQVFERETDKIPREKIYSVLHNAGFARR